jgi:hypothetical protein
LSNKIFDCKSGRFSLLQKERTDNDLKNELINPYELHLTVMINVTVFIQAKHPGFLFLNTLSILPANNGDNA